MRHGSGPLWQPVSPGQELPPFSCVWKLIFWSNFFNVCVCSHVFMFMCVQVHACRDKHEYGNQKSILTLSSLEAFQLVL